MSVEFNDELLSAMFDGELSAEERALVEQELARSASLRSRLEDYQELRRLFAGLPVGSPPSGLRESILLQIRSKSTVRSGATKGPGFWRSQRVLIVAASIACVGVITVWTVIARQADPQLVADHAPAEAAHYADKLAEGESRSPVADGRLATSIEADLTSADDAPLSPSPARATHLVDSETLRRRLLIAGQTPTPGEKLSYLDSIGEEPVVVTYSVVDVMDAFDEVQILLEREGIRSLDGSNKQKLAASGDQRHPSVAIYMEAETAQVEAVLNQLPVVFVAPPSLEQKPPAELPHAADAETPAATKTAEASNAEPAHEPAFQFVVPIDPTSQQQLRNQPVLQNVIQQQANRSTVEARQKLGAENELQKRSEPRTEGTLRQRSNAGAQQVGPNGGPLAKGQQSRKSLSETGERVSVLLILQGDD